MEESVVESVVESGVKLKILGEAGYDYAMLGLSLNKNQTIEAMPVLAEKLAPLGGGHNKFLESIDVWLDITVPRYIWQDLDTYRMTTKQSESTNHTIMKGPLTTNNFVYQDITKIDLEYLNHLISECNFLRLKRNLPEGFLQRRIWKLNYSNIRM